MTEDPDSHRSRRRRAGGVRVAGRARLPPHPRRRRRPARRHRVDARPDERGADPAGRAPVDHEAPPGLEGVVVAETTVGDVRGLEGFYHYRQYNAVELADKRPLEDVWNLLFDGQLPTRQRARGVPPPRSRRCAGSRDVRTPGAARDRASVVIGAGRPAHRACRWSARREGFKPTLDIDADERRAQRAADCARSCRR